MQEKAQIILQNCTSNITTQDFMITEITILINHSNGISIKKIGAGKKE